jgi:hypothetical protein
VLKVVTALFAAAIAFCIGGWVGGIYCDRYVVPGLIKQYPNDGQLGLEVMVYAVNGGLIAGVIVFVAGIVWTGKTTKSANSPLAK